MKLNLRFIKGVPDSWLSGTKDDLWLELKYVKPLPPVIQPTKYLTTHQAEWLRRRHAEGRSVGVLIGSPSGHLFFPGCSWEDAVSREKWIQSAKTTKEIAEILIERVGEVGWDTYNSPHETDARD